MRADRREEDGWNTRVHLKGEKEREQERRPSNRKNVFAVHQLRVYAASKEWTSKENGGGGEKRQKDKRQTEHFARVLC